MTRYSFDGELVTIKAASKANVQKIGETLETLRANNGGKLTPKAVVDYARNSKSPLHRHFEWDDVAAAERYRLDQARELIRVVRVEQDDGNSVRAFYSINSGGTAYHGLDEVRATPSLQDVILKQALRDLRAFEQRYRDLQDVCESVREAQRKVGAKLKAAEQQVAA